MDQADFKIFGSAVEADGGSNGGRESYSEKISAQLNNIMPPLTQEEREAGGSRLRKVFFHNVNASNETLTNARILIKSLSTGEDHYVQIIGDHLDTQSELTGSEKQHGSGKLAVQGNAGATQIKVNFDDAGDIDLEDGDLLWLYDSGGPTQQWNTVNGAPTWNGNEATINLTDQLIDDFPVDSICAMVVSCGNLIPSFDSWVETSPAGTYDEVANPPELENWGTPRDDWTITFTSATEFTCSGLYEGSVGSGNISSDFAPVNPNTGNPYFTLRAAGWGGTWAAGDTITFSTYASAKGIWLNEIWPAGTAYQTQNDMILLLYGE